MNAKLIPAESVALTVALAQVLRGETPPPNTSAMCILALARLTGRHDWIKDAEDQATAEMDDRRMMDAELDA